MNDQLTEENVANDSRWGPHYRAGKSDEERWEVYQMAQQEYDNLKLGKSSIRVTYIGPHGSVTI